VIELYLQNVSVQIFLSNAEVVTVLSADLGCMHGCLPVSLYPARLSVACSRRHRDREEQDERMTEEEVDKKFVLLNTYMCMSTSSL